MTTAKIYNAIRVKDGLKARGWKFNGEEKTWEKQGEWQTPEEVETEVRAYGGVRNRSFGPIQLA